MSMRIYIAGSWLEQYTRARPMLEAVRAAGLVVTHDWTIAENEVCLCGDHVREHVVAQGAMQRPGACKACQCAAFNGIAPGSDSLLTREYRIEHATMELTAVREAQILWHLASDTQGSSGSWVELGAALMARELRVQATDGTSGLPHIVVSGKKNRRAIFTELANELYDTDAEALARVIRIGS